MTKPISRTLHGLIDYNYVAVVREAPALFGFSDDENAVRVCGALAGTVLATTVLTRAEWGFFHVVPFKTHLQLDVFGSLAALAAPWLFDFSTSKRARNAFLAFGIFGLTAVFLSRSEEMD